MSNDHPELITGDPDTELDPEFVLSALEQAIQDVCDEDTQNEISDRYRELIGDTDEQGS